MPEHLMLLSGVTPHQNSIVAYKYLTDISGNYTSSPQGRGDLEFSVTVRSDRGKILENYIQFNCV